MDLLEDDQFFQYLELKDKAPAQAQSILDRALINYYKSVRPSAVQRGDSDEEILKYGISSYVMSIITEHSVSRYLIQHHIKFDALGGSYDTIWEQRETLGQPDFSIGDKTLEIKSTGKASFTDWYSNLLKYDSVWKLHNADSILLFTGCSYSRTTNTFHQCNNIYLARPVDGQYVDGEIEESAVNDLMKNIENICKECGINCKTSKFAF